MKQPVFRPAAASALALHDRQAHQRLGAGQVDAAGFEGVFVVEVDRGKGHRRMLRMRKGDSPGKVNPWPPFRQSGVFGAAGKSKDRAPSRGSRSELVSSQRQAGNFC